LHSSDCPRLAATAIFTFASTKEMKVVLPFPSTTKENTRKSVFFFQFGAFLEDSSDGIVKLREDLGCSLMITYI
jgi:hypothetical protein